MSSLPSKTSVKARKTPRDLKSQKQNAGGLRNSPGKRTSNSSSRTSAQAEEGTSPRPVGRPQSGQSSRRTTVEEPQLQLPPQPSMAMGEPKRATIDRFYLSEVQEQFSYFDGDNDNRINSDELARLLRTRGFNPSDAEIANLVTTYDEDKDGLLTFQDFLNMLPHLTNSEDTYVDLYEAFRAFDKLNRGVIRSTKFKHILTTHGEKLSEEDANEFIKFALDGEAEGDIKYVNLIDILMGKTPLEKSLNAPQPFAS